MTKQHIFTPRHTDWTMGLIHRDHVRISTKQALAADPFWKHLYLEAFFGLDTTMAVLACGETHCDGHCAFPALIIPASEETVELKARSVMTAHGPVMSAWRSIHNRDHWRGTKVEVPAAFRETIRRLWW